MVSKIGLVLGGGGSRGLAHVGVLQVLAREQVPIDLIVGTSMGGIVGALFAYGIAPDIIAERINQATGISLFGRRLFSARARQKIVRDSLAEAFEGKTFADLQIPLTVMAVDMRHGEEVALNRGPLIPALLASSAVPAVFPPVEIDGRLLADGGVIDSMATHIAFAAGADFVIGVDVYPPLETESPWQDPLADIMGFPSPFSLFNNSEPSMLAAMWRAVRVMTWHLHQRRLQTHPPHLLLCPAVMDYGSLDFKDTQGPIMAGVVEAERHLPALRSLVDKAQMQIIAIQPE
jgi:NTE family protein